MIEINEVCDCDQDGCIPGTQLCTIDSCGQRWNHLVEVNFISKQCGTMAKTAKFAYMKQKRELTAIIEREGNGYVALCPELDVASQGETIEKARGNLIEALELFFETASDQELKDRMHDEVLVTRVQVAF